MACKNRQRWTELQNMNVSMSIYIDINISIQHYHKQGAQRDFSSG